MAEREELHPTWEPILEVPREQVASGEHREAVRAGVGEHIENTRQQMAHAGVAGADDDADALKHVKQLTVLEEPEKVAYLGKIALEDGIGKAVRLAEKTGSAYVIDALHDLLVDELVQELERRHKV